jgi:hypothetical protein
MRIRGPSLSSLLSKITWDFVQNEFPSVITPLHLDNVFVHQQVRRSSGPFVLQSLSYQDDASVYPTISDGQSEALNRLSVRSWAFYGHLLSHFTTVSRRGAFWCQQAAKASSAVADCSPF